MKTNKILHRLSHVKSVYDYKSWERDNSINIYRMGQMSKNSGKFSQHPQYINDQRSRSMTKLQRNGSRFVF